MIPKEYIERHEIFDLVKDAVFKETNELFQTELFMSRAKQHMIRLIEEEVNAAVKNADLHKIVGDIIKLYMKDNIKDTIKIIVTEQIMEVNRKLDKDYRRAKKTYVNRLIAQ